jgi:mono/diheme cytochrome c family protein
LALRQWDQNKIQIMLGSLDFMHNGVMPPFAGTDAERAALAAYLSSVEPVSAAAAAAASDGQTIFEQNCAMCHQATTGETFFNGLPRDPKAASESLKDLTSLLFVMPDLKLSNAQRVALVQWINAQRGVKASGKAIQGGS